MPEHLNEEMSGGLSNPKHEELTARLLGLIDESIRLGIPISIPTVLRTYPSVAPLIREQLKAEEEIGQIFGTKQPARAEPPVITPGCSEQQLIGKYRLLRELGRGGQAVVYEAEDTELNNNRVALRVSLQGRIPSFTEHDLFGRTVDLTAKLEHNAIVRILEAGEAHGQVYAAMQYVAGKHIDNFVRDQKLSLREIVELFLQLTLAVGYAHERGVIHRDLKPPNILVSVDPATDKGQVHILDFGLAKVNRELTDWENLPSLSSPGLIIGTLRYMSPEQAAGRPKETTTRSDVYSLGIMLFELITGFLPYGEIDPNGGDKAYSRLRKEIVEGKLPRFSSLQKHAGQVLELIIFKALELEPGKRYVTGIDFAADLNRYLTAQPPLALAVSTLRYLWKKHKRACVQVSAVLLGLVLVFTMATVWFIRNRDLQNAAQKAAHIERAQKDARSNEELRRNRAISNLEAAAAYGKDPDLIGEAVSVLRLWDWQKVKLDGADPIHSNNGALWPVAFRPDGSGLVTRTTHEFVEWRLPKQGEAPGASLLTPPEGLVSQEAAGGILRFAPSGKLLAAVGKETLEIWRSVGTGRFEPVLSIGTIKDAVQIAWSRTGNEIAAALETNEPRRPWQTKLWKIRGSNATELWAEAGARCVDFHPKDDRVALGMTSGEVLLYGFDEKAPANPRLITKSLPVRFKGGITCLAWADVDGTDAVIIGSKDADVAVWRVDELAPEPSWTVNDRSIKAILTQGRFNWFATVGYRSEIVLWNASLREKVLECPLFSYLSQSSISNEGRFVAVADEKSIKVIELLPGRTWKAKTSQRIRNIAYSADSSRFATLSNDWTLSVRESETSKVLASFDVSFSETLRFPDNSAIALDPRGERLAYADHRGNVRLWDLVSAKEVRTWSVVGNASLSLCSAIGFSSVGCLRLARHEEESASAKLPWRLRAYDLFYNSSEPRQQMQSLARDVESPGFGVFAAAPLVNERYYVWVGPRLPASARGIHVLDTLTGQIASHKVSGFETVPDGSAGALVPSADGEYFWVWFGRARGLFHLELGNDSLTELRFSEVDEIHRAHDFSRPGPSAEWFVKRDNSRISILNPEMETLCKFSTGKAAIGLPALSPDGRTIIFDTDDTELHGLHLGTIREELLRRGLNW